MEKFWAGNVVNHKALPSMCKTLGSIKSVCICVCVIYAYIFIHIKSIYLKQQITCVYMFKHIHTCNLLFKNIYYIIKLYYIWFKKHIF